MQQKTSKQTQTLFMITAQKNICTCAVIDKSFAFLFHFIFFMKWEINQTLSKHEWPQFTSLLLSSLSHTSLHSICLYKTTFFLYNIKNWFTFLLVPFACLRCAIFFFGRTRRRERRRHKKKKEISQTFVNLSTSCCFWYLFFSSPFLFFLPSSSSQDDVEGGGLSRNKKISCLRRQEIEEGHMQSLSPKK